MHILGGVCSEEVELGCLEAIIPECNTERNNKKKQALMHPTHLYELYKINACLHLVIGKHNSMTQCS